MIVVTREQMREMDRRTIEGGHVSGEVLMERAGRGIYRSLVRRIPELGSRSILILCGKGNNGGDGFVLARLLRERGLWPEVWSLADPSEFSGDARVHLDRMRAAGVQPRIYTPPDDARAGRRDDARADTPAGADRREAAHGTANDTAGTEPSAATQAGASLPARIARLSARGVVVDALFGTGLKGPLRGAAVDLVRAVNACPARVLAIDIPSGLSADPGPVEGEAVRAEWTVSMAAAKPSFFFSPGRDHVGDLDVVDIGIPDAVRDAVGIAAVRVTPALAARWLPDATGRHHKGRWGRLFVAGGSPGLGGAIVLAARGALRTGAGLVRLGLPRSLDALASATVLEAMTVPLPEGEDGQLLAASAERILGGFGDWDALALGPGLGRFPETERLVMKLLGGWSHPLVLDADALFALAQWGPDSWVPRAREIRAGDEAGGLVLTPHPGELARLTGRAIGDLTADPPATAAEWAERWGVTLVFKGAPSVVAAPDGRVWINGSGNSGLATGGSGDVLTGVIGALLAQGATGPVAAALGSYLHGRAADLAVAEPRFARRSLLPTDVLEHLPHALAELPGESPVPGRTR